MGQLVSFSLIPNIITILRIFLIIPFAWYLQQGDFSMALTIFLIAGLSDGLDGLLAKRFNWQSRFGSISDPLADKLLLLVATFMLALKGEISWYLFAISTSRDLFIVSLATWFHYRVGPYDMQPSIISKWNTALMILLILLVLLSRAWFPLPEMLLLGLEITVIATCIISWLHYSWLGRQKYKRDVLMSQ